MPSPAMNADEQAIRSLIDRWHTATAAGDVEAVLELMTDDAVFLAAGRPPMRGRKAFAAGLRKLLETHTVESSAAVQEVEVSGDLAYSWSVLTVRMTEKTGKESSSRSGSALSILRRDAAGRWALMRDANLLGPPA